MSMTLSPRATSGAASAGILVVAGYAGFVAWSATWAGYQTWAALVVLPVLFLASAVLLHRAGRRDPDPRFMRLLVLAFVFKALATIARYLMAFVLYDGVADAAGYNGHGGRLAMEYRAGNFDADIGRDFIGTGFIRVATGVLYTMTGQSVFVGYAVFSWLGFWGLYFMYRAFRVALPDGDARRYAVLVLFLPSMLFWPSSLGKEGWMTFGLGLAAYGSALLLTGDRRWPIPLLMGLTATAMVRPHITAAFFLSLAVAYTVGRSARPATELTPLNRAVAVVALCLAALFVVGRAADFLGVEEVSVSNVDEAIDDTSDQTSTGGSSFQASDVESPIDFPMAVVTVLFRPFPFEASNGQMLIAAAEGSLLLLLFARSLPRLRTVPQRLRRQPFLVLCLCYSAVFVYAFSNFSNFGILTRERVQVLPFVLVLLALASRPAPGASVVRVSHIDRGEHP